MESNFDTNLTDSDLQFISDLSATEIDSFISSVLADEPLALQTADTTAAPKQHDPSSSSSNSGSSNSASESSQPVPQQPALKQFHFVLNQKEYRCKKCGLIRRGHVCPNKDLPKQNKRRRGVAASSSAVDISSPPPSKVPSPNHPAPATSPTGSSPKISPPSTPAVNALAPGSKKAFLLSILAVWRFAQRAKEQENHNNQNNHSNGNTVTSTNSSYVIDMGPRSPTAFLLDP